MKLKRFTRNAIQVICSSCLALSGVLFFDKVSVILFGEPEYPEES